MLKNDELAQRIIQELDIGSFSEQEQEVLISKIGENIMKRITLEILKTLPEEKHEEFEKYMSSGKFGELKDFLNPYIPNFDDFTNNESKKEIEAFKQKMAGN